MQKSLSLPYWLEAFIQHEKKNVYEHKKEMQDTLNFIKKFERNWVILKSVTILDNLS